ncbi:MAG: JAB domain-containing protein [Pseudomonadota bacterium]
MIEHVHVNSQSTRLGNEWSELEILTSILDSVNNSPENPEIAKLLLDHFLDLKSLLAAEALELLRFESVRPEFINEISRLKHLLAAILQNSLANRPLLQDLDSVFEYFKVRLFDQKQEQLYVLFLDQSFHLIGEECIARGTVNHVAFSIRELLMMGLRFNSKHLILVHNHPGSLSYPSIPDILMTNDIIKVGSYLDINVADHIIIASDGEFSFRKNDLLQSH